MPQNQPMQGLQSALGDPAQQLIQRGQQTVQKVNQLYPNNPNALPTPGEMPQEDGMMIQALRALGLAEPSPAPRTSDIELTPEPIPVEELLRRAQAIPGRGV